MQFLLKMELRKVTSLLWIAILCSQAFSKESEEVVVEEYEAVAGVGEAELPCNYTPEPEPVSLVLWYRGQERVPIYTVDFRRKEGPRHFAAPGYAGRATAEGATLRLGEVGPSDGGSYRCKVEFRRFRTVVRMVRLKVLVPPHSLVIMDERGERLKETAGPYDEGAYLALICEAEGGDPSPSVVWWRGGSVVDASFHVASSSSRGLVRNEIALEELRRTDHQAELSCRASNTNLTHPLTQTIRLHLNLKPLYVRITTPQRALRAGEEVRLHCESSGSLPPAKITWWVEGKRVQSGQGALPAHRNMTSSTLALMAAIDDNGKTVHCRAENTALAHAQMQDSWTLNILFRPEVRLHLGANIKYSTIREGNDVYMECSIRANPPVQELTWLFEGRPFLGNASGGLITSNQSLVLQRVRKEHRGRYRCLATNAEGEGSSDELQLEVRYAPFCAGGEQLLAVSRDESVNVSCEVSADPQEVSFRWALNSSLPSETTELQGESTLSYAPRTAADYGALLCWARNAVGEQREPCVARIVPAGPPDPVRECRVSNRSATWLWVECEAGYDGGLPQRFHLDAYDAGVRRLRANASSPLAPRFHLRPLPPATPLVLVLYAANAKGRSNEVAITAKTLPQTPQSQESALSKLSPLVGILLAALGTLLMIGVVGLAFVQLKRRRPAKSSIEEDKSKTDVIVKKLSDEFTESATACPDVVPPNNTVYLSPDGESICEISKDAGKLKSKENYRNCVVALKRSWTFKKGHQGKTEVEVAMTDLNEVMSKQPSTLLGDVTLEDTLTSKKIVVKVEPSPESLQGMYRTDSV